ncbi:MAG: hypothetical protein GF372_08315 [Candidatus Marinimicrobia bacterium]|nr:hypothetical protein [Candidatus Neomarinimicrobiota bacterium]
MKRILTKNYFMTQSTTNTTHIIKVIQKSKTYVIQPKPGTQEYELFKIPQDYASKISGMRHTVSDITYDFGVHSIPDIWNYTLNLHVPPSIRQNTHPVTQIPPTIQHVLGHLSAGDSDFYYRLLDTLAAMMQTGQKIATATIFQGVDWCGARLFAQQILMPLFGREYTSFIHSHRSKNLRKRIERNYIIFDELAPYDLRQSNRRAKNIRRAITTRQMTIAGKTVQSNATWFLYFELPEKIQLAPNDDLFTVSPYISDWIDQTNWWTTEADIRDKIAQELPDFAAYLHHRTVNPAILQHSLKNAARQALI